MPRGKKETHLFFEQGDDELQIRSWDQNLNAAIRKMKAAHPETVWIRENDDDEPGFLWGAVRARRIGPEPVFQGIFSPILPQQP